MNIVNIAEIPIADIIFGLCMLGGILSLWQVVNHVLESNSFRKQVEQIVPPSMPAVSGTASLTKAASVYVGAFKRAVERNLLPSFDVSQRLEPVRSALYSRVAWPKGAVGLLILGSLLVTLLNLQTSVARLGDAFKGLSTQQQADANKQPISNSAKSQPPKETKQPADKQDQQTAEAQETRIERVQRSMATIAESARSAFQRSGWIILFGVTVLFVNMYSSSASRRAFLQFTKWAEEAYDEALWRTASRDPGARVAELGKLIDKMHEISTAFHETSSGLSELGNLGNKLEQTTGAISEAISKLPDSVKLSVTGIGGEVARYLSEDMKHQLEYLKTVAAIYGHQETRIQDMQKILTETAQSNKVSADSLRALPAEISALRQAITGQSSASNSLKTTVEVLSVKVDALPIMDLKKASDDMDGAIQRLATAGKSIAEYASSLSDFLGGWRSVVHTELEDVSRTVAKSMSGISTELLASLKKPVDSTNSTLDKLRDETGRLKLVLEELAKRVQTSGTQSDIRLSAVSKQLDELQEALGALHGAAASKGPWWKFGRNDERN